MAFLGGLFGGGLSGVANAGNQATALALLGQQQSLGALDAAQQRALAEYGTNYYDPYSRSGQVSNQMLQNALGLEGDAGTTNARNAFRVNPGYEFQLDQGLQGLDRSAAARGLLGSGNHSVDVLRFSQGLADQSYADWLNRLTNQAQSGLQAAAGQTARQSGIAGLHSNFGQNQANVYQNTANSIANSRMNLEQGLAQARAQQGKNLLGTVLGGLRAGAGFI